MAVFQLLQPRQMLVLKTVIAKEFMTKDVMLELETSTYVGLLRHIKQVLVAVFITKDVK